ncbi:MAG: pilin [Pseudonocardiaceae bacterium]
MAGKNDYPPPGGGWERGPLDAARTAFAWLVTGPEPVSIQGRAFPGLPNRPVPLDELRDLLLARGCPQATRDAVWAHLVGRCRAEGGTWTVGCVGMALPALTRTAAGLSARFASDRSDIHAAVLGGFLTELGHVDLGLPCVMARLRWAAYRAGHTAVRDALDAPIPAGDGFGSTAPAPPWGHPDFVLARAVAEGILTPAEAELIGATRLEGLPLRTAAAQRATGYQAVKKARRRAEYRLAAYLRQNTPHEPHTTPGTGDLATQVADTVTITTAAATTTPPPRRSPSVTEPGVSGEQKTRPPMSPTGPENGVQRCGGTPPPAPPAPAEDPARAEHKGPAMTPHDPTSHDSTACDSTSCDSPSQVPAVADLAAADLGEDESVAEQPVRRRSHPARRRRRYRLVSRNARRRRRRARVRGYRPPAPQGRAGRRTTVRIPAVPAVVIAAVAAVGVLVLGPVGGAHADTIQVALATSVDQVLTNIRNFLVGLAGGVATVFLTIAGVRYGMAGGDPGEVDAAKRAFKSAGVGYGVMLLAPLVVEVLKGIVGS